MPSAKANLNWRIFSLFLNLSSCNKSRLKSRDLLRFLKKQDIILPDINTR